MEFKSLNIIHLALVVGCTLFFIIVNFVLRDHFNVPTFEAGDVFTIPAIILILLAVFGSPFVFMRAISTVAEDASLDEKMTRYRTASIIKWALIEGPCLFLIVCTLLSPSLFYIGASFILIFLLIMNRPSKEKMSMIMRLNQDEQAELFGR